MTYGNPKHVRIARPAVGQPGGYDYYQYAGELIKLYDFRFGYFHPTHTHKAVRARLIKWLEHEARNNIEPNITADVHKIAKIYHNMGIS